MESAPRRSVIKPRGSLKESLPLWIHSRSAFVAAMPLLLELFSGTGSIGKAFREAGWEVFSLDIDSSRDATWIGDVRAFDPATLPRRPDLIWASPVCTHYSIARAGAKTPRDLEWADSLVLAALRIQEACGCPMLMENPHSSMLKRRPFMQPFDHVVVDYCKWWSPDFPHKCRKRTAIFRIGGADYEPSRPLCAYDCGFCEGRRHVEAIGHSTVPLRHIRRKDDMYRIPPLLCEEIARWASRKVSEAQ